MAKKASSRYKRTIPTPIRVLRILTVLIVVVLLGIGSMSSLKPESEASRVEGLDTALLWVEVPENTPEIKLEYTGFNVSFNPEKHIPNYVSWELTGVEANGNESNAKNFRPDTNVNGCAELGDYRRSGFDRGHMAPAADMKWSAQAREDCYLLTNIAPQDHQFNAGVWNALENKCRTLAERDSALVIITGPVLSDRLVRTIGDSEVAVPERFFKVLFAPYADTPQAIAFVIPNRKATESYSSFAMTVDDLEQICGYDFFSELPDDVEQAMESQFSYSFWELR